MTTYALTYSGFTDDGCGNTMTIMRLRDAVTGAFATFSGHDEAEVYAVYVNDSSGAVTITIGRPGEAYEEWFTCAWRELPEHAVPEEICESIKDLVCANFRIGAVAW
jgi:hypothetical protein